MGRYLGLKVYKEERGVYEGCRLQGLVIKGGVLVQGVTGDERVCLKGEQK